MNKCKTCSANLNDNAKFCKECGAKVDNLHLTFNSTGDSETIRPQVTQETNNAESTLVTKQSNTISLDVDLVKTYISDYGRFLKETLLRPASVFKTTSWINGLISIIIFATVQMTVVNYDHFATLFKFLIFQAIVVGVLLVINKGLLNTSSTIADVVTEYGGLMNTQSIIFILAGLIGLNEGIGIFVMFVALLNQLNIYNYYLFNNQTKGTKKLDGYYQIVIAYIVLAILVYYGFRGFLNF
ncbi:hypothetical protein ACO1PF_10255 [Alkalibacterium sp. f15]|uniref:hypothetical protein n=1 Tax=Alkalibacterium sp. f15 TaxID=3414029 RepID=UPI003BF86133